MKNKTQLAVCTFACTLCLAHAQTNLDPRILNNISLGPDPAILPTNQRAQVEPHIARSYSDPSLLVASWQSGRYAAGGGAIGHEYAISRDGGSNWVRGFVPGLTAQIDGGPFERITDPVVAISFENTIYLNSIGFFSPLSSPPFEILVSSMNAEDMEPGAPVTVYQDDWPNSDVDKNWIAVNSFPGTSNYGQIVTGGTLYQDDASNNYNTTNWHTFSVVSSNDGQSWSGETPQGPDRGIGVQFAYLPNGDLAASYWLYKPGTAAEDNLAISLSTNGGQSYGPPISIAEGIRFNDIPNIRDGTFFHSMTTDRLRGIIYVSWQEKSATGQSLIQFARSLDRGHTWSAPVNVRDATVSSAFNPAIAASPDGQHISILFYDSRGQISQFINNVYLAESFDGGETWEPNILVSEQPSDFRNGPLTSSGYFYGDYHAITPALDFDTPGVAIWIDGRNGNPDPYVAQIARTEGTTFETWRRLRFSAEQLADPSISGEGADPDGDRIPNVLEYVLGLEPDEVDLAPFEVSNFTGPNSIELTYTELSVVRDKVIFWEQSTNLVTWQVTRPISTQVEHAADAAFRRLTVQFTGEDTLFLRMGVTCPDCLGRR